MKRVIFIGFTLIILVAMLLACAPAAAPSTPATPAKPAAGPVKGGILRLSVMGEGANYDSMSATTALIQTPVSMVMKGLIETDPMDTLVTVDNIKPALATKWEISPDGKVWTFTLRQGVKWHDGKPFTAADVVYTLNKFKDPKKSAFAETVASIDKVEQSGDYTVKVTLKAPNPDLLISLLPPYCSIQANHLSSVDSKTTAFLVGTGPFKFKQYVPGKLISFERNPDYYEQGLPYLDGVEIYYLAQDAMPDAFIGGQVDVIGNMRSFFDADITHVQKVKKLAPEAKMYHGPSTTIRGLFFSFVHEGPWRDIRVRKAMTMVIDPREAAIAMVGGLDIGHSPGAGYIPYTIPGAYPESKVNQLLGIDKPMATRVAEAKKLMADAGYANGFKALNTSRSEAHRANVSLYCNDMWKRNLNIDIEFKQVDSAAWTEVRKKGEYDVTSDGIVGTTGLLLSEYLALWMPGSGTNYGNWKNDEYVKLVDQYTVETDKAKRLDIAQKAQAILYAELPFLPITETGNGTAWRPDLMTGWPAKEGIVCQAKPTNQHSIDRIWLAGTDVAKRWMKK